MFTIKRAAELTGVPEATLRAWERRYGIGAPLRTPAGYRLYDAATIATISAMKRRVAEGQPPQQAAAAILANPAPAVAPTLADTDLTAYTQRFLSAALALDGDALTQVLDTVFSSASFETVVDQWLVPAMAELGGMWLTGEADIAAEHFASHTIMRKLSGAYEAAGSPPGGKAVIIGSPQGSMHEIGSLAFATALRRRGTPAIFLGADLPVETWVATAGRHRTGAVAVSVTTEADVPAAQRCVDAMRDSYPHLAIAVGGPNAAAVAGADLVLSGSLAQSAQMMSDLLY